MGSFLLDNRRYRPLMNPVMKIIIEVTTNVMSTEDDTAAASEHSAVVLDSGTFSVSV